MWNLRKAVVQGKIDYPLKQLTKVLETGMIEARKNNAPVMKLYGFVNLLGFNGREHACAACKCIVLFSICLTV